MKRIAGICTVVFMVISLCSCASLSTFQKGDTANVTINYGESEIYDKNDIDTAVDVIKYKFAAFNGCTLYSLTYAGDEASSENINYCRSLENGENCEECIVFKSSFRTPKDGGDCWNSNMVYEDWKWYLAREKGGNWKLLTWGVG